MWSFEKFFSWQPSTLLFPLPCFFFLSEASSQWFFFSSKHKKKKQATLQQYSLLFALIVSSTLKLWQSHKYMPRSHIFLKDLCNVKFGHIPWKWLKKLIWEVRSFVCNCGICYNFSSAISPFCTQYFQILPYSWLRCWKMGILVILLCHLRRRKEE